MDGSIVSIIPLNSDSGKRAYASQQAVAKLREGIKVPGTVLIVSKSEARIFKPPTAKGAHKSWDEFTCLSGTVAELDTYGICLSCVMNIGVVKSYSIPGLKEIGEVKLSGYFDKTRLRDTILTDSGYILGWTSQAECLLLHMWGKGQRLLVTSSFSACSIVTLESLIRNHIATTCRKIHSTIQKLQSHPVRQYQTSNGSPEHNTLHRQILTF